MKVMIVDDSSFILLVCKQALEKSGYEVVGEAYDGVQAIEVATQAKPDLIIMDIALPKKNGFEATTLIQEILPKTKVLAISAVDEDWVKDKAIQAGCFEFLAKPFDSTSLIRILDEQSKSNEDVRYG